MRLVLYKILTRNTSIVDVTVACIHLHAKTVRTANCSGVSLNIVAFWNLTLLTLNMRKYSVSVRSTQDCKRTYLVMHIFLADCTQLGHSAAYRSKQVLSRKYLYIHLRNDNCLRQCIHHVQSKLEYSRHPIHCKTERHKTGRYMNSSFSLLQ